MSTGNTIVEQTDDARYAVRAKSPSAPVAIATPRKKRALAEKLNPDDHADGEHGRNLRRRVIRYSHARCGGLFHPATNG